MAEANARCQASSEGMTRWDAKGRPPWHHAFKWDPKDVQPGDTLLATDAGGEVHEVRALTSLWVTETFDRRPANVITVGFTTKDREGRAWPVESLRPCG